MTAPETHDDQPAEPEISCGNCVGACCRAGATLMLSEIEYSKHRRSMNLKALVRPKYYGQYFVQDMEDLDENGKRIPVRVKIAIPPNHGFYFMRDNCGHLTEDSQCDVYEDRPESCREYEMGSRACEAARATFGLDGHEAVAPLVRETPIEVRIPRYHQA